MSSTRRSGIAPSMVALALVLATRAAMARASSDGLRPPPGIHGDRVSPGNLARRRTLSSDILADLRVESSPDGILAFDRQYRYTVWNAAMERLSGMGKEAVLGRNAFEVFPFLRVIGEDVYFAKALAGEWAEARDRPFAIPETGREGYFEAHYFPLRDESGSISGGLAVIRDTTATRRAGQGDANG